MPHSRVPLGGAYGRTEDNRNLAYLEDVAGNRVGSERDVGSVSNACAPGVGAFPQSGLVHSHFLIPQWLGHL